MSAIDPSGMRMSERDLPERITRYNGKVELSRIALTQGDTEDFDLPSFPASDKSGDSNYRWFVENYGNTCWELDAMPANMLRQRVEEEISTLIDGDAWEHRLIAEAAERESLKVFCNAFPRA
jgi:hypothetical protein